MFNLFTAIARSLRRKIPGNVSERNENNNPAEIEVGAVGAELRYWLAKEAVRQQERSFSLEASEMAAVKSQATTLLGWIVAAVVLTFDSPTSHPEWRIASLCICAGLTLVGALCIFIIFPRKGRQFSGFAAPQLIDSAFGSELEQLESLARGLFIATEKNRGQILRFQSILGWAWICFLATPIISVLLMEAFKYHFGAGGGGKPVAGT